jgi:hypothetical protein
LEFICAFESKRTKWSGDSSWNGDGGGLLEACPEATIRQIVISWEERKKAGAYLAAV